jgi:hypothetical protein
VDNVIDSDRLVVDVMDTGVFTVRLCKYACDAACTSSRYIGFCVIGFVLVRVRVHSGMFTLAAMYLRRFRVLGRCVTAALAHV